MDHSELQIHRWRDYIDIRKLRVEPFILFYMIGYSLAGSAVSQLVQDKLCRVDYGQTAYFCVSINSRDFDHDGESIKSSIITKASYITLYRTLISTLPCILWVLFLGPWSDKYVHGRKVIMIAGASAAALEALTLTANAWAFNVSAYYVLLSFIPSALSGGIIATLMAVYAYSSATSDTLSRSFRFAIIEICFWIAQPIGLFIGGQILGNGDQNTRYQLYNYIPVFVVSLCSYIAAIIWVILVINESPADESNGEHDGDMAAASVSDASTEPATKPIADGDVFFSVNHDEALIPPVSTRVFTRLSHNLRIFCKKFKEIFDMTNVKELFETLTKNRADSGRAQIWILFMCTAFILLSYLNTTFVLWGYVEKLYSWPPKFYSNVTSAVAISTLLLMGLLLPVLVGALKFGDINLSLLGTLSLMAQCLLRGSWQHEAGLYFSFIFGTLAPLSLIGLRSRLSKIIEVCEQGKLFALLAIVEAITPGIASIFYSLIFATSIDVYPGLSFQVAAFILLIPFLSTIFIDVYCVHDYDQPVVLH